ncbi:MAG: porin [Proteobacteria bacterium]|nr:porin [Pseudomonadota bacterium]
MVMGPQGADASFGGFYQYRYVTFGDDNPRPNDETETLGDSELFVAFSRVADNGVEYSFDAQLEVVNGNQPVPNSANQGDVDEAYITLGGDFGRVRIGNDDHASGSYQTWLGAAGSYGQDDVTYEPGSSRFPGFVHSDTVNGTAIQSVLRWYGGDLAYDDASKIAYYSPNFSGFNFGVSWLDVDGNDESDLSWGASYSANAMGYADVTLRASSRTVYDSAPEDPDEETTTSYGVEVLYDALTVVASVVDYEVTPGTPNADATTESSSTSFGVGYDVSNDLNVAFYYTDAESDTHKQSGEFTSLSGSYVIAPGLSLAVALNTFELTDSDGGYAFAAGGGTSNSRDGAATNEGDEVIVELGVQF